MYTFSSKDRQTYTPRVLSNTLYYILLIILLKLAIFYTSCSSVLLGFFVLTANKFKRNKKDFFLQEVLLTRSFMHMTCIPIFKGIGAQFFAHGQVNISQVIQLLWWHKQILFLFKDGIIQGPLVLLHYFCWTELNSPKQTTVMRSSE